SPTSRDPTVPAAYDHDLIDEWRGIGRHSRTWNVALLMFDVSRPAVEQGWKRRGASVTGAGAVRHPLGTRVAVALAVHPRRGTRTYNSALNTPTTLSGAAKWSRNPEAAGE